MNLLPPMTCRRCISGAGRIRTAIWGILLSAVVFGALSSPAGAESPSPLAASRPNIVLVITDDQGYGELHCHGNKDISTPNLDRLHDESLRFTAFHASPTCAPTRAAIMTGRHE